MKTKRIVLLVALVMLMAALSSCFLMEHNWIDATCTTPKTCADCGATEGEALGHVEETVPGKTATCTETGLTDGIKCSICDEIVVAQEEIPAKGHSYDNACDIDCNVCDADREVGDHVYSNACDTDCNECGATREVGDHVYDNACDTDCNECGTTRDVGEHGYDNACDTDCNECGAIREVGDHVYDNACDTTCNECNAERTVPGHDIVEDKAVAPTCEATGLTAGEHCSICDYKVEQEVVPAIGHKYEASYTWSEDNSICAASGTCTNKGCGKTVSETETVSVVTLNVSKDTVTYTYKVEFANKNLTAQTKFVDGTVELVDSIATINAPAIAGRVASHDYVKFGFHDETATYEFNIYYSEVDVWDGTSVSESLSGSGTAEDPYLIQSGADLAYIAQVVNALNVKTAAFSGNYFVITKSIDLNGHALHIGTGSGWGTRQIFAGYLDGNNCTIRGINNTLSLFGCIEGGWAKNLSLYGNVEVAKGSDSIGVFVGYLRLALLENITNYANINGNGNVGGLVGNMEQSTDTASKELVNYGTVSGVQNVGGIAGLLGRYLTDSTNWGAVNGTKNVGGVVANLYWACSVTNCTNYGTVSGGVSVGGVAGVRNGTVSATLTNCVNNGKIVGTCETTTIDGITSSDVTKTNCVNNGSVVLEHSLTYTAAVEAGCETEGNVEYYHCSICEKNYNAEGEELASVVISATGHDYEAVVTPPTCEVDGYTTYTCKNGCGSTYTDNIVKAGHKDDNGDYKCDRCEENLCVDHAPAEAVKENEVKATCEAAGSYENVVNCSICGFELSREKVTVDALGHKMDDGTVVDTVKTYTCLNGCGKTIVKYLVTVNYLFLDGSEAAEAEINEYDNNEIYTIYAKEVDGYVASHDYVKGHILSAGGTVNIYYSEVDVWDGTSVSESLSGSGTEEDPYLIQSAADLAYVAKVVNDAAAATTNFSGQYFKMTKSIDLNGNELKIGSYTADTRFYGSFDGNNCAIKGINGTQSLFGKLYNGYIKNLSTYGSVTTTEKKGVAGLVSYMTGATVENITNYVNVTGVQQAAGVIGWLENNTTTVAKNCVNYGNISATSYQVGGIAGFAKGSLSDCTNFGDVTSKGGYVGGVGGAGLNAKGSRSNLVNYGNVSGSDYVGGVFGQISATTTNCYSYGTATATKTNVGEVVGSGASYLTYAE